MFWSFARICRTMIWVLCFKWDTAISVIDTYSCFRDKIRAESNGNVYKTNLTGIEWRQIFGRCPNSELLKRKSLELSCRDLVISKKKHYEFFSQHVLNLYAVARCCINMLQRLRNHVKFLFLKSKHSCAICTIAKNLFGTEQTTTSLKL